MRQAHSRHAILLIIATTIGCAGDMPPPPVVKVTSPQRGMIQSDSGELVVTGITRPGTDGAVVTKVLVNKVPATLAADGSFTATVTIPAGATLLETVAISAEGGTATDARAIQVGQLRPVGANIEKAITAAVSRDAFARLSAAAGPLIKDRDLTAMLAPLQPMANLGDSIANLKLSITKLELGDVKLTLTPVDGGLQFSAELAALTIAAKAAYGGALIPDGSTTVGITADKITIGGTLVVTAVGTDGFTTKIATPTVKTTNLKLSASGLVGDVLDLLNNNLASTVQSITTRTAEKALDPLINEALGALAGPKRLDVLGKTIELQTSPSAITFTSAGALVTLNLQTKIAGSEKSPGYIYTPNGSPAMSMTAGIQLGLADDLLNQLLAQVHALGILDIHLEENFGIFDTDDIKSTIPPMISANTDDGSMRLVLGDMVATFADNGKPILSAAINAQVELQVARGTTDDEIALQFGDVRAYVNVLGDGSDEAGGEDDSGAAKAGIALQLGNMSQFLITVPLPAVAGVSLDNLALRADAGYVLMSGNVH